ncbi:MAG: hypothetical protein HKM93_09905 [Desulfobacteraceae bacterium]|nr:hypothetical protein [Desulfobacteraceae bacterium]
MVIRKRFCGPPTSANGGYTAGLIAKYIEGAAQVTLFSPPPLEHPLTIERDEGGEIALNDGDSTIAVACATELVLDVPAPPSYQAAETASERFSGFDHHLFPGCFVCGPDRRVSDGLRIFAGPSVMGETVIAPWLPDATLTGISNLVKTEFVWSALDCAGYFACQEGQPRHMLLGRFSAQLVHPIASEKAVIVSGWPLGAEGRKFYAGTAIHSKEGVLCAKAKAVWILAGTSPA